MDSSTRPSYQKVAVLASFSFSTSISLTSGNRTTEGSQRGPGKCKVGTCKGSPTICFPKHFGVYNDMVHLEIDSRILCAISSILYNGERLRAQHTRDLPHTWNDFFKTQSNNLFLLNIKLTCSLLLLKIQKSIKTEFKTILERNTIYILDKYRHLLSFFSKVES